MKFIKPASLVLLTILALSAQRMCLAGEPDPDWQRLAGSWDIVGTFRDGGEIDSAGARFTFDAARRELVYVSPDGGHFHFTDVVIDSSKTPKEITGCITRRDKRETHFGIYACDGNVVVQCWSLKGRPTSFHTSSRSGTTFYDTHKANDNEQK